MSKESLQTVELPTAVRFVKKAKSTDGSRKRADQPPTKPAKEPPQVPGGRPVYQHFSTRIRRDLRERLKRLSHYREERGDSVFSMTQFVEDALEQWLSGQDEPPRFEHS